MRRESIYGDVHMLRGSDLVSQEDAVDRPDSATCIYSVPIVSTDTVGLIDLGIMRGPRHERMEHKTRELESYLEPECRVHDGLVPKGKRDSLIDVNINIVPFCQFCAETSVTRETPVELQSGWRGRRMQFIPDSLTLSGPVANFRSLCKRFSGTSEVEGESDSTLRLKGRSVRQKGHGVVSTGSCLKSGGASSQEAFLRMGERGIHRDDRMGVLPFPPIAPFPRPPERQWAVVLSPR
jgi:hypothetical protein